MLNGNGIAHRGKGRPNNPQRKTQIAACVHAKLKAGMPYKESLSTTAMEFSITADAVRKHWTNYRKYGDLLGDPSC